MNSGLKQRLVGAVVLIAVAIIFVPGFLREKQVEPVSTRTLIPDPPERETMTFESPSTPEGVEPAPSPNTMFMPQDERQPVVDSLEEAQTHAAQTPEPEDSDVDEPENEENLEADADDADVEASAANESAWVVQVASFRSGESARNLRDRLQQEGYRAYVREASTSGGEVSRVYIGPKIHRKEAEEVKSAVDQSLRVESMILRFEP